MHAFTDGRDTLPHAGAGYLARARRARPATRASARSIGRYWAMDRDRRWDRTQRAYDLLVHGGRRTAPTTGEQAVRDAYERGETDEFIEPTLVGERGADRARRQRDRVQLPPRPHARDHARAGRARRSARCELRLARRGAGRALRDADGVRGGLALPGRVRARAPGDDARARARARGATQLHVAETEKYPHVTYFFNGGEEAPHAGERRELVASPRDVPTYDHKPQMSAREAARGVRAAPGARTSRASGSSTSPTPTWSGTRA